MDDLLEALQFAEARLEELGEHELVGKCAAAFAKFKEKNTPQVVPQGEPVAWMNEDELPEKYPYDLMYKYSKVDVVRMFPVFAPSKCEQEPLYFGLTNDHTWISITEYKYNKLKDKYRMKVYTTPPSVEAAIDWSNLDFQCHALQQIGANWYDGKVRNQWIADTCHEMKKHIAAAIRSMK